MSIMYHDGNRDLQDRFDSRRIADRLEEKLTRTAFIDDDKAFIARVLKTKKVAIDVVLVGDGKKTLVFETGGLDMSHLSNTTKKRN